MELENLDIETLGDMYLGLENNPELKSALETELQNRIDNNTNFSREYLVRESIVNNHALGIQFIPNTESYNNYGRNITVAVSENEDLEGLIQNYTANPPINTFGNIRLRVLVDNNLTQEQIEALDNEGIDTSHISHILGA
jgi:hypothetical protein